MKVKILIGSDFPLNKKEVRAEAGEVLDLPDKVAKALIKNNAAEKFDSKMKRARTKDGRYRGDDKSTPNVNEAWENE